MSTVETSTSASNPVVRESQSQADYNPLAKQKADAKLSRIPVKVVQGEVLKKPDFTKSKTFCAPTSWSPSAKKPVVRTLGSALEKAQRLS
jgi:hypothetical protein